jgi:pimeloyl-ACP methyl ester carboxylesterase
MRDKALLPVQLSGLEELVHDLEVVRLEEAGHFAPWEAAAQVAVALHPFLAREPASSGGPP